VVFLRLLSNVNVISHFIQALVKMIPLADDGLAIELLLEGDWPIRVRSTVARSVCGPSLIEEIIVQQMIIVRRSLLHRSSCQSFAGAGSFTAAVLSIESPRFTVHNRLEINLPFFFRLFELKISQIGHVTGYESSLPLFSFESRFGCSAHVGVSSVSP